MDLFLMLGYSVIINSILAVFNLIPIPPLDGSRILAMFLPITLRLSYLRMERYGILIILLLLLFKKDLLFQIVFFFIAPLLYLLLGTEGIAFIIGSIAR